MVLFEMQWLVLVVSSKAGFQLTPPLRSGLAGMTAGWRCVAVGGLYGKWRSRGVLMKPPPQEYIEQP